jgi:hypothetical protein
LKHHVLSITTAEVQYRPELDGNPTPKSWASEGTGMAQLFVYLSGELLNAHVDGDGVPEAPPGYASAAGTLARVQVGKAGVRLAGTLAELVK